MKDTFLDFQNPGVSYSSKKSPMFHSYPGGSAGFSWNLPLPGTCSCNTFLGGIWDIFVTCNPFLSRKVCNATSLTPKFPQLYFPPKTKLRSLHAFLYILIPSYTQLHTQKKPPCEKKEKNKTAPKKSEQNSCDRPVTPLILRPGVILSTVSLGGPTNWLIFCCRGISCFEIVSLCRNYPC